MKSVSIKEAARNFERLIACVEAGEEVVIRRHNRPVAKLVACETPAGWRVPGSLRGAITVADDFDAPLGEFGLGGTN